MKMLISCFGTEIKPCKTIYILKGYTDSYSDLNQNIYVSLDKHCCSYILMIN